MPYDPQRALDLLRLGTGLPDATFRDGQEEAIRHVVEGRGRLLLVQRTGWGKSFVYFIAIRLLREQGEGPALLISPLLSLMRNQIAAAARMGVAAVTINSSNVAEWEAVEERLRRDEVDVLLVSPERLTHQGFRRRVLAEVSGRVALLVIDEAHCISDWGHDFRPSYRLIERVARNAPPSLRLVATTATANDRVLADLEEVLGPGLTVERGELDRPSLALQTIRLRTQAERLAWLAEQVTAIPGSGIVYTLTKRDAGEVADWLRSRGLDVYAYTGDTGDRREELEEALLANEVKALVATTALGMGFDKPDLSFVVHYQAPGSVVAYYQQVGRAGRAVDAAYGVLLSGEEELAITDSFIDGAFPDRAEVERVIELLGEHPKGLSQPQMLARVNIGRGRLDRLLAVLALESPAPFTKVGTRWQLTGTEPSDEFWQRAERLTTLRREEQRQMQDYVALDGGHMEFLIAALDGDTEGVRGPDLAALPEQPDPALVREAETFLKRTHLPIEPRKRWPPGGMPSAGVKGNVAGNRRAEPGLALCRLGDAGWGRLVRSGLKDGDRFADELVAACAEMVREWAPEPAPRRVSCVPSRRHPGLVEDFAERLADALGLPFSAVLQPAAGVPRSPEVKRNSTQRAHQVDGSLRLTGEPSPQPVLLVDDLVDSRWTFTVAAWLLRGDGGGEVWPLALAWSAPGGS
ncbi:MAG TPA: RecQ family ATP-dependent DNA helicase [Thermoanaerobaculia bacterium]|nr:RecQ family ATP-dependent DNA helicase [Thermoanaerobaculia bacterium]